MLLHTYYVYDGKQYITKTSRENLIVKTYVTTDYPKKVKPQVDIFTSSSYWDKNQSPYRFKQRKHIKTISRFSQNTLTNHL